LQAPYSRHSMRQSLQRPEKWWGVAWLIEFWFTVALACATILSLFNDQNIRNRAPAQAY
jgi:hypothetical protein